MSKVRVGIYYRHIFGTGGYPRDVLTLMKSVNRGRVDAIPITGLREFFATRSSLHVVHLFGMFNPLPDLPLVAMEAWRSGLPSVWSPLAALLPYALERSRLKKKVFLAGGGKLALQHASVIHVFTDNEMEAVRRLGIQRPVFKAPFGLYPEDTPSYPVSDRGWGSFAPFLLFLGRLEIQQKGVDILLDGFRQYLRSGGQLNLIICGRNWKGSHDYVQKKLEQPETKGRIRFLAEVTDDEKFALMKQAVAFVYPTRHDGPPRPLRDALLLGKRILTTREANLHDDIESLGWGYHFAPQPSNLAEAIKKFENESNPPQYVDPLTVLSWERIAHEFVCLYHRLASCGHI